MLRDNSRKNSPQPNHWNNIALHDTDNSEATTIAETCNYRKPLHCRALSDKWLWMNVSDEGAWLWPPRDETLIGDRLNIEKISLSSRLLCLSTSLAKRLSVMALVMFIKGLVGGWTNSDFIRRSNLGICAVVDTRNPGKPLVGFSILVKHNPINLAKTQSRKQWNA
jgi:hypothetical protein